MRRRKFLAVLAAAPVLRPPLARAQRQSMPLIGYVSAGSPDSRVAVVNAFRQGLSENGYSEGHNVVIEYRWAEGKLDRFPALIGELVALNVDVIVTAGGTLAALAAQRATTTLPIVFTAVGDPVAEGLVASLARPGGNITGLSFFAPDLAGKRLQLLKEAVPDVRLIALLLKPDAMPAPVREARLKEADASARALGVRLRAVEARGPEDFGRAFSEMAEMRAEALTVWATPIFVLEHQRLAEMTARNRLPAVSEFKEFANAGGLLAYGPNLVDLSRRAGIYSAKILKGAKPADLPVEQPTRFELVINMRTAAALGLTIPPALLARADEVIE